MTPRLPRTSRPISALLVGVAVTCAVGALHYGQMDRWVELKALDLRFRLLQPRSVDVGLVRVEIDAGALEDLGPWPWPRDRLAGIVDTLSECGARTIVLDMPLREAQLPRYELPPVSGDLPASQVADLPAPVFDDSLLARAIRAHGQVFLPIAFDFDRPAPLPVESALARALRKDVTLPAPAAAKAAGGLDRVDEEAFHRVKQDVIDERVGQVLRAEHTRSLDDVAAIVLGSAGESRPPAALRQAHPAEWRMTRRAYLYWRAMLSLARFALPVDAGPAARAAPPLVSFAQAAGGAGFVDLDGDADGRVRHVRLLARAEGGTQANLALAAAARVLYGSGVRIVPGKGGGVLLRGAGDAARMIPTDGQGRMLINWSLRDPGGSPSRISAARLAGPWTDRRSVEAGRRRAGWLFLRAAGLADTNVEKQLNEQFRTLQQARWRLEADAGREASALLNPSAGPGPNGDEYQAIARARAQIRTIGQAFRTNQLRDDSWFMQTLRREARPGGAPRPDEGAEALRTLHEARRKLEELLRIRGEIDAIAAEEARLTARIEARTAELKPMLAGKVCLLGPGSPAIAWSVATPHGARTPSVHVHAAAMRTILSGAFLGRLSRQDNLVVVAAAGLVAALVAATFPPVWSLITTLVLGGGYAAFNTLVLFGRWHVLAVLAAPLVAMLAVLVVVGAFRQATEQRARRRIRRLLRGSLGAPELADVLDRPKLVPVGPRQGPVSCVALELAGMTAVCERLGTARTAWVVRHVLMLAKEGITGPAGGFLLRADAWEAWGLFGAPLEQADHPARAVRAALAAFAALDELDEQIRENTDQAGGLDVHVGVASGAALTGYFGALDRGTFTATGPAVDLAAQLRAAAGRLDVNLLASEETCAACGELEGLLMRPLGRLILPGRQEAHAVWQICTDAEAGEDVLAAYADFARAVELFAERKFAAAGEMFASVREALGPDRPSELYAAQCQALQEAAPDDHWDPALRIPPE